MIRFLVESSLRFRPLVIALAVVLMFFGVTRLDDMPIDVFPEILPVTVNVQTEALGLSAAEVEQLITVPLEADLLAGTPWVESLRSESVAGLSAIELTFKSGTNLMDARQVVQERLNQAHVALPLVTPQMPRILQPLSSTNRIMMIGLSSKTSSLIEMSVLARWTIRPRLLSVPGVANVSIWGQRERQLQVLVDPKRLTEKKVSLNNIIQTAGNALWFSPLSFLEASIAGTGGFVETPNQRLGIRHVLPISTADDLAKVPVEGTSMRLDEAASVVEDHQPLIGDAMDVRGSALLLVVEKLPGVNTPKVTRDILAALGGLKPGLPGIEFDPTVYRPANYIQTAVRNVGAALLLGLILVAVALLALTSSWRAALVGLIAIPLSLMVAIVTLYLTGSSMNAMVLAGLVIALGVMVDDGIIDAENFRRRQREGNGRSRTRMIVEAWSEMRRPLVFATLIVLLAAVPLLFVSGVPGAFVRPLVLAYVVAVLASLVVATIVTPVLGSLLLGERPRAEPPLTGWLERRYDRAPVGAAPRAAVVVAVLVGVVGVVVLAQIRPRPAPTFKEPQLMIQWDAMPGTSRAEMTRVIELVSRELRSVPGVRNVGAHVGRAILADQVVGINSSELWVGIDPKADYQATVAAVDEVVAGYPGIDADVTTYLRSRFGGALSGVDEPIVVRLYGQQQDVLLRQAEKVRQSLAGIRGLEDPRVEIEAEEPIVEVEVDLQAAQAHGIKPGDVRRAAGTLLAGLEVGNLYEEQKLFQVVVWGEPRVRHSLAAINALMIDRPQGGHVRLGEVARVRIVPAPQVIRRENVARRLDVVANVNRRPVDAVTADVRDRLGQLSFPLEYRAEVVGDFAEQQQAGRRVLWVSLGVAIGILVLLQAAFGSWRLALAVLLTLPIAVAGGAIAATAVGAGLSLGALVGLLTVLGIAVRSVLVLVRRYGGLRKHEGLAFGPELIQSGIRERAPAIVTGAIVTAAAVLPFAVLGSRPGEEILGPLAWVILGGLVTTTLYTLAVVPALYAWFGAGAHEEQIDEEVPGGAVSFETARS